MFAPRRLSNRVTALGLVVALSACSSTATSTGSGDAAADSAALDGAGDAAVDASACDPAIDALAPLEAPNMAPEGACQKLGVTDGGAATTTVSLQMGKCYTIIAASHGVTSLELQITSQGSQIETNLGGTSAVLGAGAKCIAPLIPSPQPYTVRATSHQGAGTVNVQLFSRVK